MIHVCRKISSLVAVALLWCCNGDDTLLDRYPIEPIVNPEVGILISDNHIIHADFDGRQQISGVTQTGLFTTNDRFRSLDFAPNPWGPADGLVVFGGDLIVHAQADSEAISMRYSNDQGRTWTKYEGSIVDEHFLAAGDVSVVQLSVAPDGSIWVLCQQERGDGRRALLYRVDLEPQRSTLMVDKAGAMALDFGFADALHGWVLYGVPVGGADGAHVLRTENGGRTWTGGAIVAVADGPAVAPIATDALLIYDGKGTAFHSADGGISFKPVSIGGPVVACQVASPGIVYALLENGLAKSADGGATWAALDAVVHGVEVSGTALDFHGERAGIVYGADRLFITNNGGQSWDVLVYPYDYVID